MANLVYGLGAPTSVQNPKPIIATRAPTTADLHHQVSTIWTDKTNENTYILNSVSSGAAVWDIVNIETATSAVQGIASFDEIDFVVTAGDVAIAPGIIQKADITVSAAELILLMSAPKELVAAPAAGYAIHFIGALISNDFGVAAYNAPTNAGDDLAVVYAGGAQISETLEATGFINAAADLTTQIVPAIVGVTVSPATALQLDNIGAAEYVNPGTATGELKLRVMYRVVNTGL